VNAVRCTLAVIVGGSLLRMQLNWTDISVRFSSFQFSSVAVYTRLQCCACRWIVEAMKLEYGFGHDRDMSINNLSPSRIKKLLKQVVSKQPDANGMYVSPLWFTDLQSIAVAYITNTKVNSAFHPSGVPAAWLGLRSTMFTFVGWQVCDPIWQVTLRSAEMGSL